MHHTYLGPFLVPIVYFLLYTKRAKAWVQQRYPVLLNILGTCCITPPKDLYQNVIDNFTYLYNVMMEQGRISEYVLSDLGFPRNKDVSGNEVLRTASIIQQSHLLSKRVTHNIQINLQKECIECIENEQKQKSDQLKQKRNEELHSIGLIEGKLLNMITENEAVIERSLNQCTVDMFDKLTSAELSDFIWAHDPNVLMKKDISSNKGKLEDGCMLFSIV